MKVKVTIIIRKCIAYNFLWFSVMGSACCRFSRIVLFISCTYTKRTSLYTTRPTGWSISIVLCSGSYRGLLALYIHTILYAYNSIYTASLPCTFEIVMQYFLPPLKRNIVQNNESYNFDSSWSLLFFFCIWSAAFERFFISFLVRIMLKIS